MTTHLVPARTGWRIAVPFAVVTLIWGSTWLVIRDQLGTVPASWSVTYRFLIAGMVMFGWIALRRLDWRLSMRGHGLALLLGGTQFMLNFNLVYRAEAYITSGVVALVYALLLVPNALLARIFLGQRLTRPFLIGSAIGVFGVGLMFVHEFRQSALPLPLLLWGLGLTALGLISASAANVMQATPLARREPLFAMLAYAMLYGALMDAAYAWATVGPPVLDTRPGYWAGVGFLAVFGSVVTFPLYSQIIRDIGPARAAYTGVLVPVIAMILSTLFEGYRWSALSGIGVAFAIAGLVFALNARNPERKSG